MNSKLIPNIHPLVCVWMITYNHEQFIAQAIEGILMQKTTFQFELVIGEDNSTDKTSDIIKEFADKYPTIIRARFNKPNMGMMPNMQRTLEECTGKYVALCEGDDYWTDPYKLQKQVDFLEAKSDYAICFHNVKINKHGEIIDDYITRKVEETTEILDLAMGNYIHTASCVYRNNLFDKFPLNFINAPIGDYYLHMLNAQYGKIKRLDEVMAIYRIHEGACYSSKKKSEVDALWVKQYCYMINKFSESINNVLKAKLSLVLDALILNNEIDLKTKIDYVNIKCSLMPESIVNLYLQNKLLITNTKSIKFTFRLFVKNIKNNLIVKLVKR